MFTWFSHCHRIGVELTKQNQLSPLISGKYLKCSIAFLWEQSKLRINYLPLVFPAASVALAGSGAGHDRGTAVRSGGGAPTAGRGSIARRIGTRGRGGSRESE